MRHYEGIGVAPDRGGMHQNRHGLRFRIQLFQNRQQQCAVAEETRGTDEFVVRTALVVNAEERRLRAIKNSAARPLTRVQKGDLSGACRIRTPDDLLVGGCIDLTVTVWPADPSQIISDSRSL